MPNTHHLKAWPEYYCAVEDGRKPFEVRKDDRNYEVGDLLVLQEYEPGFAPMGMGAEYTGRECRRIVTYVLRGYEAIASGYVVLGLCDA